MFKNSLLMVLLLMSISTLIQAQTPSEKEFITVVKQLVKDGNISSVSKVSCHKGDCQVKDLLLMGTDAESGVKSELSVGLFKVEKVDDFISFKQHKGEIKEGESRSFSVQAQDIKVDGENPFFNKKEMARDLGEKSELYRYFKKYLDAQTDGAYRLDIKKSHGDIKMKDQGQLHVGAFKLGIESDYSIKGGFAKIDELSQSNPMGIMAIVTVHHIKIHISNPKGFLRNITYMSYVSEMKNAKTSTEKKEINVLYYLSGATLYSKKLFVQKSREMAKQQIEAVIKKDPAFNSLLNKNGQFEKKVDAILAGSSQSIDIKIDNTKNLNIGDFFTIVMSYAMQQKLRVDHGVVITIK